MTSKASAWLARYSLVLYFILAYAISWAFWIPISLTAQGLVKWNVSFAQYYLGSFGPMLSALIVTALIEGRTGIRVLLGRVLKWRVSMRYYVFAILAPAVLFGIAVLLNGLWTGAWPDLSLLGKADYLPYLGIPVVFVLWLLTYGLGEETGWRGFALPHLQSRRSAASSALILGALWAGWHTPAFFFRDTYMAMGLLVFPMVLVSVTFASVIFTWLYNATGGSLLIVILFHALFDWLSVSDAGGQYAALIMGMAAVLWAVFVMRRYGPENAAPIGKQIVDRNAIFSP
jgi:membrane protease YdiL (CAAX protease family)